jgi:hypothetical protein
MVTVLFAIAAPSCGDGGSGSGSGGAGGGAAGAGGLGGEAGGAAGTGMAGTGGAAGAAGSTAGASGAAGGTTGAIAGTSGGAGRGGTGGAAGTGTGGAAGTGGGGAPGTGRGGAGTGGVAGAGGTGGSAGTGGDAGVTTCGTSTDPSTGAGCNTPEATGPCVTETLYTGVVRAPSGGSIGLGTYDLTSMDRFVGADGGNQVRESRRGSLVVSNIDGNAFALQITEVSGTHTKRRAGAARAVGTQVTFTPTCPVGDGGGTIGYTAVTTIFGATFILFETTGSGELRTSTYTTTYTMR